MSNYTANAAGLSALGSNLNNQASELTSLVNSLNHQVDLLGTYKAKAESATSQSVFSSYKTKYENTYSTYTSMYDQYSAANTRYIDTQSTYDALAGIYTITQTAREAQTTVTHLPNFKDKNQWLPGGELRNATLPGGSLWGTDKVPVLDNEKPNGTGFSTALLSGNILSMLNSGFTSVHNSVFGGVLDLMADYDIRHTVVMSYKIRMLMSDGTSYSVQTGTITIDGREGNGAHNSSDNSLASGISASLADVKAAYGMRISIQSIMANPVGFAIDIISAAYSGTLDLSNPGALAGGIVIGTVQQTMTTQLTRAVINAFGIVDIGVANGVSVLIGGLISELSEMALGLDDQFGYGGTLVGIDATGRAHYADIKGGFVSRSIQDLKDSIGEFVGAVTGDGYASATEKAAAYELDKIANLAKGMTIYMTPAGLKAAENLVQVNAAIEQNMRDRGLLSANETLNDINASTIGWDADIGDYTTSERDQRNQSFDFGNNENDGGNNNGTEGIGSDSNGNQGAASCFVAGTVVKTIEGDKHIENIVIGDKLIGIDGVINTVLAYDCPLLGNRKVYSINGNKRFCTAEHPLLTTDGWKAICPEDLKKENNELYELLVMKDKILKVSDRLITIDGIVEVINITSHKRPSSSQLYNFKLDGNHTYYANDIVVHNKI